METTGNGTRYLTADLRFRDKRKRESVYIEELDCTVILQQLSVLQIGLLAAKRDLVTQLSMAIVDENGDPIYRTVEQLQNLAEMPSSVADKLFAVINRMAATNKEAQEDILKN